MLPKASLSAQTQQLTSILCGTQRVDKKDLRVHGRRGLVLSRAQLDESRDCGRNL
jgi:hypothetical protein